MSGEELQLQLNVDGYLRMNLDEQPLDMLSVSEVDVQAACRIDTFQSMNIHSTSVFGPRQNDGKPFASSVGQAVGDIMSLMVGRYQTFPSAGTGLPSAAINWDSPKDRAWYNYAFFPVIRSYGKLRRVMTYVAFYSNFDPWLKGNRPDGKMGEGPGTNSPQSIPGRGAENVIPLSPPQWLEYTTTKDPVTMSQETVYVDMQYIGNDDCRLSIQATLENTRPADRSFICIFPFVTPDVFRDEGLRTYSIDPTQERASDSWKVSGPSLGIALAAAILGAPSIYYTGFIRYIIPDHVLNKDRDASSPYTRVSKQINFVEFVDQVPLKAAYCATHDLPLIFPNKDEFQKPQSDKMSKIVAAVAGFLPNVYTTADLEDGRPFMTRRSATPLCMVATISEMMILSSYLWIYSKRFTSIYTADIEDNADAIQAVSEDYFATRAQKLANDAAARAASNASWKSKFARDPMVAGQEYMDMISQREVNKLAESDQKSKARIKRIEQNSENRRMDSIRRGFSTVGRMSLKSGQLTPDEIVKTRKDMLENRAINKQKKKPKLSALANMRQVGKFPVSQKGAKQVRQSNPAYLARLKMPQSMSARQTRRLPPAQQFQEDVQQGLDEGLALRAAQNRAEALAAEAEVEEENNAAPLDFGPVALSRDARAQSRAAVARGISQAPKPRLGDIGNKLPGSTQTTTRIKKEEDLEDNQNDDAAQPGSEAAAEAAVQQARVNRRREVNNLQNELQAVLKRKQNAGNIAQARRLQSRIELLLAQDQVPMGQGDSEAAGLFSSVGGRIGKGIGKIFGRGAAGARIGARAGGIVDTIASRNRGIGQKYGARLGGIVGSRFGAPSQGSAYGGMAGTYLDRALERDDYPDTSASGHYQQELSPSYSFRRN